MRKVVLCLVLMLIITACAGHIPDASKPTDDPNTPYNEAVVPGKGQPPFPKLGDKWVIDSGCGFSDISKEYAHEVFENLRRDHIAEVTVVCQTGIINGGPSNDKLIWTMDWGNWARLGDAKDKRALVVLFQPDVKPEDNRVTLERSDWAYSATVIDYFPVIEEAAGYANYGQYDEALETVARGLDDMLRRVIKPTESR